MKMKQIMLFLFPLLLFGCNVEPNEISYTIHENLYDTMNDPYFKERYAGIQRIEFENKELSDLNEQYKNEEMQLIEENGGDFVLENGENVKDDWTSFTSRKIDVFESDKTITLVFQDEFHVNHVGGNPKYNAEVYHIDKKTHQLLSNEEMLQKNEIELNAVQTQLNLLVEEKENILNEENDFSISWNKIYGSQITDESCLYIDEEGRIRILLTHTIIGSGNMNQWLTIQL